MSHASLEYKAFVPTKLVLSGSNQYKSQITYDLAIVLLPVYTAHLPKLK